MAISNVLNLLSEDTFAQVTEEQTELLRKIAAGMEIKPNPLALTSWGMLQRMVRAGVAQDVLSIYDQIVTHHSVYGDIVWNIMGFDYDTPADSKYTHALTLQTDKIITKLPYDRPQALYYCEEELPAGWYYFFIPQLTLGGYKDYGCNKYYAFELSRPVPAGGQICFEWKIRTWAKDIPVYTYAAWNDTQYIETTTVYPDTQQGTFLGVADGTGTNINHIICAAFGTNRYKNSCIRQWANSAGGAWSFADKIDKFDRVPTQEEWNVAGFLNGLDHEFVNIIGAVNKNTVTNQFVGSTSDKMNDIVSDKIWIPSMREVHGGDASSYVIQLIGDAGKEGNDYAYYTEISASDTPSAAANVIRAKTTANDEQYNWWLRSPERGTPSYNKRVYEDGRITYNAEYTGGISLGCCIV